MCAYGYTFPLCTHTHSPCIQGIRGGHIGEVEMGFKQSRVQLNGETIKLTSLSDVPGEIICTRLKAHMHFPVA